MKNAMLILVDFSIVTSLLRGPLFFPCDTKESVTLAASCGCVWRTPKYHAAFVAPVCGSCLWLLEVAR
jgi:hypothetical protein